MTRTNVRSVTTLSLFVLVACGSADDEKKRGAGDANGDPSRGPAAPLTADEQACDELYQAQVAWTHRCGGILTESQSAIERFRKLCARELAATGAGGLREARARCTELRAKAPCDAVIPDCELPPGALPEGAPCAARSQCESRHCKLDVSGCGRCAPRVPVGGECALPIDCAFGDGEVASCDFDGPSPTGTCSVWKLSEPGEECSAEKFCNIRAHCETADEDAKSGTCAANKDEGGACDDTAACRLGLVCRSGRCSPRPAEGETCTGVDECADGLGCDGTCKEVVYVGAGEPCDAIRRCDRGRCVQRVEEGPDGKLVPKGPATCIDPLADGNACGPEQAQTGLVCDHFARCLGGHCVFSDPSACH